MAMVSTSNRERAADLLVCSANLSRIEFYASKYENKQAELDCRIFGLSPMTELELKALADCLNRTIEPVLTEWSKNKLADAQERLSDPYD